MAMDNKGVYSTVEYNRWAKRASLTGSERFLVEQFLDPTHATVEAGTAGGRILLELLHRGFNQLSGFDYVAALIEEAKRRDNSGEINFSVMDATALTYPDAAFRQALYLQQIISLIETEAGRRRAVAEAFRVLRRDGTALFSFLCFEARQTSLPHRIFMMWISILRALRGRRASVQLLPWLKLGDRFNWPALRDAGPYVYWFRMAEARDLLASAGFHITAVGTDAQMQPNGPATSVDAMRGQPVRGHMYFICRKPEGS
jgi:SAM-dependent methyltransferase